MTFQPFPVTSIAGVARAKSCISLHRRGDESVPPIPTIEGSHADVVLPEYRPWPLLILNPSRVASCRFALTLTSFAGRFQLGAHFACCPDAPRCTSLGPMARRTSECSSEGVWVKKIGAHCNTGRRTPRRQCRRNWQTLSCWRWASPGPAPNVRDQGGRPRRRFWGSLTAATERSQGFSGVALLVDHDRSGDGPLLDVERQALWSARRSDVSCEVRRSSAGIEHRLPER